MRLVAQCLSFDPAVNPQERQVVHETQTWVLARANGIIAPLIAGISAEGPTVGAGFATVVTERLLLRMLLAKTRHRFDPVKAIKEIESAGSDFVDYSPQHYRPADDLALEVGHENVAGQTDRWRLKFVKP